MTNIIKFPKSQKGVPTDAPKVVHAPKNASPEATMASERVGFSAGAIKGIWVVVVLVWPLLKWIIAIDCVFQFIRMVYYWNTPGTIAGLTFLLHFSVLCALTYFVSCFKPKGL